MIKKERLGWASFTVQSTVITALMVSVLVTFFAYLSVPETFGPLADAFEAWSLRLGNIPSIPLIILAMPLVSGLIRILLNQRSLTLKDEILLISDFIIVLLVLSLYPALLEGPIRVVFAGGFGLGISFQITFFSYIFVLLSVIVWFFVMMYAHEYMKKENHNRRFFVFLSLSYTATLGIFLAGDLLTLFFAYEMLTIMTYLLVAHSQTEESIDAANEYLFMGILGGFAIFVALVLMYPLTGSFMFTETYDLFALGGGRIILILILLMIGFGVKAGMFPLHVWLPKAHPVAPSPASSLLSGIMIKVGVFGLFQTLFYFFIPSSIWSGNVWFGEMVIWLGIITMVAGVFFALIQSNIKKLLAYHSVSQMGYILMGVGVAILLGEKGGVGFTGALYHILNHALFKSILFMVAGLVILRTHESNMYELGGLYKKLPITMVVSIMASLGIAGFPLFNGYVSKVILHHAIVEAATYHSPIFYVAEWIFIAVSAGTVASFLKFNYFIFFGRLKERFSDLLIKRRSVYLPMMVMATSLFFIGIFPRFLSDAFFIPMSMAWPFDLDFTVHGVIDIPYFSLKDLTLTAGIWAGGISLFVFGVKYHWFHLELPGWLHIEYVMLYPLSALLHGLLTLIDRDHTQMDLETYETYKASNYKLTFKDHLVAFSDTLNQKYEGLIIKSDALIYAIFLTGVVIVMGILSFVV